MNNEQGNWITFKLIALSLPNYGLRNDCNENLIWFN